MPPLLYKKMVGSALVLCLINNFTKSEDFRIMGSTCYIVEEEL